MGLNVGLLIIVQAAIVIWLLVKLRQKAIGKLGFLFMVFTFVYHGLTEIVQYIFPGHDDFRPLVTEDSLQIWIALVTGAMCLFTIAYWSKLRLEKQRFPLAELRRNLSGSHLLKWPVLVGLGLTGLAIVATEQSKAANADYFAAGFADQFAALVFSLALATLCITVRNRWHVLLFLVFAAVEASYGSRLQVVVTILTALSVMARCGIPVSARTAVSVVSILVLASAAISVARGDYGVLRHEGALTRIESFGSGTESASERIMEDSVYRFDGNSYAAMIVEKQLSGYGITGWPQVLTTLEYQIPSFIYRDKLDLDTYLRNEEAYQDRFYNFDEEIDYISDTWSLLTGYVGMIGLLLLAPCLGWLFAALDNWLAGSVSVTAYLCGICLSVLPTNLELGLAGIPYTLRGLAVLLIVAHVVRSRKRAKKIMPPAAMPAKLVSGYQ